MATIDKRQGINYYVKKKTFFLNKKNWETKRLFHRTVKSLSRSISRMLTEQIPKKYLPLFPVPGDSPVRIPKRSEENRNLFILIVFIFIVKSTHVSLHAFIIYFFFSCVEELVEFFLIIIVYNIYIYIYIYIIYNMYNNII